MKNNERYICLDTETTGISVKNKHKIIEIGCVEVVNGKETGQTYHAYLNPDREIDKEAQSVHGISLDSLQDKPRFQEIADEFTNFISNSTLVIHNATFDINFLNYELELCGLEKIENPVIDTLILARKKYVGERASLDALCKKFEVDLSSRNMHGALLDAGLLAKVFIRMDQEFDINIKKIKYIVEDEFIREPYDSMNFTVLA
jgi:DNA polymerase-3 subunit epsilon